MKLGAYAGFVAAAALTLNVSAQSDADLAIAESMIKLTSKVMYLRNECGVDIDKEKYKEIAKIYAFSEGLDISQDRIHWERLIVPARTEYQQMAKDYPNGARCEELKERAKHVMPLMQVHPKLPLKDMEDK